MRMHGQWSAAVTALTLAWACGRTSAPSGDVDRETIARAVQQRSAALLAAIEQRDLDRVGAFFTEEADVAFAGGGSIQLSRRAMLRRYREIFRGLRDVSIIPGASRILVLGDDAAVLTLQSAVTLTDTAGRVVRTPIAWTTVWVRRGEDWQVAHANQSYPQVPFR